MTESAPRAIGAIETRKEERQRTISFYYREILQLDEMPASPETMPDTFNIPMDYCGNLVQAIKDTQDDGHERAQYIGLDSNDTPSPLTKVRRGFKWAVSSILSWKQFLFGDHQKPLIHWHTHPPGYTYGIPLLRVFRQLYFIYRLSFTYPLAEFKAAGPGGREYKEYTLDVLKRLLRLCEKFGFAVYTCPNLDLIGTRQRNWSLLALRSTKKE